MAKGKLYLIPCFIAPVPYGEVLPEKVRTVVDTLQHFAVEDLRSARRYIRSILPQKDIDSLTFSPVGKRTGEAEAAKCLAPCLQGYDLGVISEAGVPAVADPGALVVREAHRLGIQVVPLSGPSSLLLALMASGLSGQNFAFNGYLPIEANERIARLRQLEQRSEKEASAQMFIETPFRNGKMHEAILSACHPDTLLCIASDITGESENISTLSVGQWKKLPAPALDKRPAVFILQKIR